MVEEDATPAPEYGGGKGGTDGYSGDHAGAGSGGSGPYLLLQQAETNSGSGGGGRYAPYQVLVVLVLLSSHTLHK